LIKTIFFIFLIFANTIWGIGTSTYFDSAQQSSQGDCSFLLKNAQFFEQCKNYNNVTSNFSKKNVFNQKRNSLAGYFFQKIRPNECNFTGMEAYFSVAQTFWLCRASEATNVAERLAEKHAVWADSYVSPHGLKLHEVIANTHSAVNNIYLNGIRIAALGDKGDLQYYLTDQVDSVKLVLNGDGEVVNKFEYLPYGETWITEGDGLNAPKYNSQELDRETSFYFYNARYYDPEIARFVTADNVVDGELSSVGWNRYAYVKGNPVVYKDPTGHAITGCAQDSLSSTGQQYCSTYQDNESGKKAMNQSLNNAEYDGLKNTTESLLGSVAYAKEKMSGSTEAEARAVSGKWAKVGEFLHGVAGGVGNYLNKTSSLNNKSGKLVADKSAKGGGGGVGNGKRGTHKLLTEGQVPKINTGKQNKHIMGANEYKVALSNPRTKHKSILTATPEELAKKAGSGQSVNNKIKFGEAGYKERVDFGKEIGIWKSRNGSMEIETTNGIITYDKKGEIHIVPSAPDKL
jgi:RHS repeat-associated protein